ncbi:MAG: hypothetical protein Q4Q27_10205, partial [Methanosarcina mazei]|nr:hypothetical protein [Methanosarcina mazei]
NLSRILVDARHFSDGSSHSFRVNKCSENGIDHKSIFFMIFIQLLRKNFKKEIFQAIIFKNRDTGNLNNLF